MVGHDGSYKRILFRTQNDIARPMKKNHIGIELIAETTGLASDEVTKS